MKISLLFTAPLALLLARKVQKWSYGNLFSSWYNAWFANRPLPQRKCESGEIIRDCECDAIVKPIDPETNLPRCGLANNEAQN